MNTLLTYIRQLETLSISERKKWLYKSLIDIGLSPQWHRYPTGENLVILPAKRPYLAVSGHVDVVSNSPGANDNASSLAVILSLADRFHKQPLQNLGVSLLIFDEEETGLKGSAAYVEEFGTQELAGLINLELVGMGQHMGLWPLGVNSEGRIWQVLEKVASQKGIATQRFDSLILNTADHESFYGAGFFEAFTLTCFSDEDLRVAQHYYKAMTFQVSQQTLWEILSEAPLFKHYHRPTDTSAHLSEHSLQQAADLVEATLRQMDRGWRE